MILILCATGTESAGHELARAIEVHYPMASRTRVIGTGAVWEGEADWDDLLIVVFDSRDLPPEAIETIHAYRRAHSLSDPVTRESAPGGFIIPVSIDPRVLRPPKPLDTLKSAVLDGSDSSRDDLMRAVGVMLGLAIRNAQHRVFISYRAKDGKEIASDLYDRLKAAGFHAYLDEAREDEGLWAGDKVQDEIREHLRSAGIIVVVDTPEAPESKWITWEISTAIGELIPVLPVVIGPGDLSRFNSLRLLGRRAVAKPDGVDRRPLSDEEWSRVAFEIKEVLLLSYCRRMRLQAKTEQAFTSTGFQWRGVNTTKRIFEASRADQALPATIVLSHCFIQDATYVPALKAYASFIESFEGIARVTHKLCVYDSDRILSLAEMDSIGKDLTSWPFILAHYNELGVLIATNFSKRPKPL